MWKDITWVSNAVVVLQCISYIVGAFGVIGILVTIKQAQRADKKGEANRFRRQIDTPRACDEIDNRMTSMTSEEEAAYVEFLKKEIADLKDKLPAKIERKLHEAYQNYTPHI